MPLQPSITRFALRPETVAKLRELLGVHEQNGKRRGLYTPEQLDEIEAALWRLAEWLASHRPPQVLAADITAKRGETLTAKTMMAIAYLDHVRPTAGKTRAETLVHLFNRHLSELFPLLHVLPHFECPVIHPEVEGPARRADGGFEPASFKMDPYYGAPDSLSTLRAMMMFDGVVNHMSSKGEWFQKFLDDERGYEDFFVTVPPNTDWSGVTRPRVHNPIVPFTNKRGQTKHVWCTFSFTQADLNLKNPKVFIAILDALVKDFIGQGATWLRLDAIGYLIKMMGLSPTEPKTSSFHLPETHAWAKAVRAVLDDLCPSATLVAEINDTKENIAQYYGEGDEAHLTYAFPCPPLSLLAFYTGDARLMLEWAKELRPDRPALVFVNSHDGFGMVPLDSFIAPGTPSPTVKDLLIAELVKRGGAVNYKTTTDANGQKTQTPYEVCLTLLQAILTPDERERLVANSVSSSELDVIGARYLATQSFMYSLPYAVPADYLGSLVGLLNDETTFQKTEHNRDKNRGLVDLAAFEKALSRPESAYEHLVKRLFERKKHLLVARASTEAFSPRGSCIVDVVDVRSAAKEQKPVASFLRHSPDRRQAVLAMTNISARAQDVFIDIQRVGSLGKDLLGGPGVVEATVDRARVAMMPYQIAWLEVLTH